MASKYDALIDEVTSGTPEPVTSNTEKYGAIIDEVTSTAPLHNSLFGASGVNPDEEAKKTKLAKELNTPAGILPADAEQQAQLKRLDADTIQQKTPATAKFLTKEENAKLTGLKGVDSLTKLEETYKTYSPTNIKKFIDNYTATGKTAAEASQRLTEMKAKGVNLADQLDPYARSGADVLPDVLKATAAVVNTAVAGVGELAKINPTNLAIEKLFSAISPAYAEQSRKQFNSVQGTLNENAEYWQNQKSPAVQKLNKEFEQAGIADSVMMLMAHPALAADMILPSSIYALPGAGVARLGAGATSIVGYNALVEAGDAGNTARQEAIAAGATPEQQDKAATAAIITAVPLVFLGGKLTGIGKLEAEFFTKGSIGDSLLKAVVKEAVSGAIEEGSNKFGTNVGASVYDENRQLLEGVGKAAVIGGVLESTHAVGMSAAERALRTFVKDIEQTTSNKGEADGMAAQATAAHDTLETLGAQVADNELRTRSPEAFKEFVETMVDDQELQDVYVDGKAMLQAIDVDFVALKQQVPELVARIEEAAQLGNDVQIPVSDYLTFIAGTPSEANVLGALKAEPSGATYKEAQDFYKSQADVFQSEVQAVADANEEVLTRDEFVAQKAIPQENQQVTEGTESTTSALPNTYEEYLAQHKNKREVYARDVDAVEETLYSQFAEAKRFTPSVNRAYVAPLVEFYKTQAKKFGTMPSELYKQYPLKIQAFLNLVPGLELNQASSGFKLNGLPNTSVGPSAELQDVAVAYLNENGFEYLPQTDYVTADPERGARIAAEYEKMVDNPNDPEVKAAYEALSKEVMLQYKALKDLGYTFELIPEGAPDPYAGGPREALIDMKDNKHLWVFPTVSGFGQGEVQASGSPMLASTDEYLGGTQLLVNDVFRIVHDVFGHAKDGFGFGPNGEENAWQSHVRMFSPLAAKAMTTETRGQNSWVNFGPKGEQNRANQKETVYAEQKIGLLPDWVLTEGLTLSTTPAGQVSPVDPETVGALDQSQTEAFKKWFGDSKVVDAGGKPLVVYHGTTKDFAAFNGPSYFTDEQYTASGFADKTLDDLYSLTENDTPNVVPSFLKLVNPKIVETQKEYQDEFLIDVLDVNKWVSLGHDGMVYDTGKERYFLVFKPTQIKSAIGNNGSFDSNNPNILFQGGKVGQVAIRGVHYSNQQRAVLSGSFYGRGAKGAEAERVRASKDARIKSRLYFYVDEGQGVFPEYGVGSQAHTVTMTNMYDGARNPQRFPTKDANGNRDMNIFESAVIDAGFDGYYIENGFGRQGVAVMLGDAARGVVPDNATAEVNQSIYYSALTRAVSELKQGKASAAQWKGMIKNLPGIKQDEVEAVGLNEWLDLQTGSVTKEALMNYLEANGVEVTEVELGAYKGMTQEDENLLAELEGREPAVIEYDYDAGANTTKYQNYVVGGVDAGSNYREILLSLPEKRGYILRNEKAIVGVYPNRTDAELKMKELLDSGVDPSGVMLNPLDAVGSYKSSHFDQKNILAHVRVDERQDPDGKRVLFVNEIQSDFGQEFKKSKNSINDAVDSDFNGIIERMKAAGVLEVNCD